VGALAAQLHNHAAGWTIPAGFVRSAWGWDALFGDAIRFTPLSAPEVWALIPPSARRVFEEAALALRRAIGELGGDPEVWGLIHADLHLDNVLFAGGEARPIDFDDSGYGYWLYDIAVALWELRLHRHWPAFRQAFWDGYARHRPVPYGQLPYLDTFIAAREAMIGLATAAMMQEAPADIVYLEQDMCDVAERIEAIRHA
jgi:Ser/Thr protein kinase RdoA (MazF antagonist)